MSVVTKVKELTLTDQFDDFVTLAREHFFECAPEGFTFSDEAIRSSCQLIVNDTERALRNAWLAYRGAEPIGYIVGTCQPYFFNDNIYAAQDVLFVSKAHRQGWATIKLIKAFEEWARLNGALQIFNGVARTDKDEAKHIRRLFPRLGYQWCGSYYVKGTAR